MTLELARGLEGQQRVASTLAAENMALTDDFNRQVRLIAGISPAAACSLDIVAVCSKPVESVHPDLKLIWF